MSELKRVSFFLKNPQTNEPYQLGETIDIMVPEDKLRQFIHLAEEQKIKEFAQALGVDSEDVFAVLYPTKCNEPREE